MNRENVVQARSGWPMLVLDIALILTAIALAAGSAYLVSATGRHGLPAAQIWSVSIAEFLVIAGAILVSAGLFVLQPNEASVLLLFGRYKGTLMQEGFLWTNPFYTRKKLSLRLRNLNGEKLKVNDHAGNPIEIAAVVVWKVENAFAACFEVDDYQGYVTTQSESAIRHLASAYPYDSWEEADSAISLRANIDEVSVALEQELQTRLDKAGVKVLEARLSHLAYAPEIAEAMLKRQQAGAIIAARKKIVEGAVGMVRMALDHLSADKIVEFDEERKAAMVSNLLVVLCGETHAQPVINAGTLYH